MKKVLKIFFLTLSIIILLVFLLSAIAKIKENEITAIALEKVEKSIELPIEIGDISFTLIRRFPLATIKLEEVWLGYPEYDSIQHNPFPEEDTLASLQNIYVSVKSRPLFKGNIEIMQVEIEGVDFRYLVNEEGVSNIDFLLDSTEKNQEKQSELSLILKELSLEDINCTYIDQSQDIRANLLLEEIEVTGEIDGTDLAGAIDGKAILSNCHYKDSKLHLMEAAALKFELAYRSDSVSIAELELNTEGAALTIQGFANLGEGIQVNLDIEGEEFVFGELIKYAPREFLNKAGIESLSGELQFSSHIEGQISDSLMPSVSADLMLADASVRMKGYPAVRKLELSARYRNGKDRSAKSTQIVINNLLAETDESNIKLSGELNNLNKISYNINSEMFIELAEVKGFMPDSVLEVANGKVNLKLVTYGVLPDSVTTRFIDNILKTSSVEVAFDNCYIKKHSSLVMDSISGNISYDLKHLSARNLKVSLPIQQVSVYNSSFDARMDGNLSNLETLGIELKAFQFRTGDNVFYGDAYVKNLKQPNYNLNSTLKVNLADAGKFVPDTLLQTISGELTAQIDSRGKINTDSISAHLNSILFENTAYTVDLKNISAVLPDTLLEVNNLSGQLAMKSDTLSLKNLRGKYKGIDFSFDSTEVVNLYKSIIKRESSQLLVNTRIALGDLDYSMFAPLIEKDGQQEAKSPENQAEVAKDTTPPLDFLVKGKLRINSVRYENAVFNNISALYNLTDSVYIVDKFRFDAFEGKHSTSVQYQKRKNNVAELWVRNKVSGMDVNKLLRDFDNFSAYYEPEITYENISGLLSTEIDAQLYFSNDTMRREKMYVRADSIRLEDGVIRNYKPVRDIEPYMPLGNKDLKVIEFNTIVTELFVLQDAIYIPKTVISSNKLDASGLGIKEFDGYYSYHFRVFLTDYFYGKSKKVTKEQSGNEAVDLTESRSLKGTPIRYHYENGKGKAGRDNKEDREKTSTKINLSHMLLNVRFHPKIINYNTGVK